MGRRRRLQLLLVVVLLVVGGVALGVARPWAGESVESSVRAAKPQAAPVERTLVPALADDGRMGYIDKSGVAVIEPQFDDATPFSEGLAAVLVDGEYGYIDATGAMVIEPQYSLADSFSEGLACVEILQQPGFAFIDRTGATVFRTDAEIAESFSEGLAAVLVDGEYGYVDATGTMVIEPQYSLADSFSEGLAAVKINGRWGFIDTSGTAAIEPTFTGASGFSDGLAPVRVDKLFGFIDETGEMVVEPAFSSASMFSEGLAHVCEDGQFGFIDETGTMVFVTKAANAEPFSEGYSLVELQGRYGFIDKKGGLAIEPRFESAASFSSGLAWVRLYGAPGYIDASGSMVWPEQEVAKPVSAALGASHLAFARRGRIWTISATGEDPKKLTSGGAQDSMPTWSPDHKTIAFVRGTGDFREPQWIWTVPAAGGQVTALYRDSVHDADFVTVGGLTWRNDTTLTFTDLHGTASGAEYNRVMDLSTETRQPRELFVSKGGLGGHVIDAVWRPSWSPDGQQLLIAQGGMDAEGAGVWVYVPSKESPPTLIDVADCNDAVWSKDGKVILVSTFTQTTSRILLVRPNGSKMSVLARGGGWEGAPSVTDARFSPDDTWIAYSLGDSDVGGGIWLMNADGEGRRALTDGTSPSWR